ncbi:MAG: hypothetical protein ACTHMO_05485 [Rhodanobacteraceae bacterium]
MAHRFHNWKAKQAKARGGLVWQIQNGHRDVVAIVYTDRADAELMARAPKLRGSLKHLIAIVKFHEGELRASERAKLAAAEALVSEINGSN